MTTEVKQIDFREDLIDIDGHELHFPLSVQDITDILGEPEVIEGSEHGQPHTYYIYQDLGILFKIAEHDRQRLKEAMKSFYIDEEHFLSHILLFGNDIVNCELDRQRNLMPSKPCRAKISFNGTPLEKLSFLKNYGYTDLGNFYVYCFSSGPTGYTDDYFDENGILEGYMTVAFIARQPAKPKRPKANYEITPCEEETLEFDNFNFKLAIIQVLMYDLEVLTPYFDIFDFAEQYEGEEIDTESMDPIQQAMDFFEKLPIPKSLAEKVEKIDMDGGNEIYGNIIPQWDGEDGFFNLSEVSERELAQFPKLKNACIMSDDYDEVSEVFIQAGIEVEEL